MRNLLKLALFFILLALSAEALQGIIDHGMLQVGVSDIAALNRAMAGKVNADIVINGSSRAMSHYDPEIIERATGESAFNLGRNGSQTDVQVAILKAYLQHNSRPKIIIQNLDHFSFLTTDRLYDPGRYIPFLNDTNIYETLLRVNPQVWRWKYLPLYGYAVEDMRMTWVMGLLQSLGLGPRPEANPLGYVPRDQVWNKDFAAFETEHSEGITVGIEPAAIMCLQDLSDTCHKNGIQLIYVYSPEYYPMQRLVKNRKQIFEKFQELARQANAPFWDYSDSEICRQEDFFSNSQHLNRKGAEVFSVELARRLAIFISQRTNSANRADKTFISQKFASGHD